MSVFVVESDVMYNMLLDMECNPRPICTTSSNVPSAWLERNKRYSR